MGYRVIVPDEQPWLTRPHGDGEPARHVTEVSDVAGMEHVRANVWRYEPGAVGRRHRHPAQDETFVVLDGTLSIYLGDPPERRDVPAGSLVHVEAGTALQSVNHGDRDLVVYAHGCPPEDEHAELLAFRRVTGRKPRKVSAPRAHAPGRTPPPSSPRSACP